MASEFILKSLTGLIDHKNQELEWPVSVTFSPFTFLINAERLDDRERWRRKKQTAILKGQNEKMGASG